MNRVHITAQSSDGSHQVRRAASASKPLGTCISIAHLQQRAVEEPVALQVCSHQNGIVQCFLHNVRVFRILMHQIHSLVPVCQRDCRTGLTVRFVVRQLIVIAKVLTVCTNTNTAGDVGLSVGYRVPNGIQGFHICSLILIAVLQQGRDIRHSGVEIVGAHSMAYAVCLIHKWPCILGIVAAFITALSQRCALASSVNKNLCGIKILLSASFPFILLRQFTELHKRQLNLFMARYLMAFSIWSKQVCNQICKAFAYYIEPVVRIIDPLAIAGIGNHRLQEMTCIVQLMVCHISEAVCSLGASSGIRCTSQCKEGVNITICILNLTYFFNPLIQLFLQCGSLCSHLLTVVVLGCGKCVGNCLDTLINIGVLEHIAGKCIVRLSVQLLDGIVKIGFSSGGLADLQDCLVQRVQCIYLLLR